MTLRLAILGFLNREELSGYDLKRKFAEEIYVHWSGNNNQIYRTLTELRRDDLVIATVQTPGRGPAKKLYSITDRGRRELRSWLLEGPEPPQFRNAFLARLSMVELLPDSEVRRLVDEYRQLVETELILCRERARRARQSFGDTDRSALLQEAIHRRWIEYYEGELSWSQDLHGALSKT
jgi:DNA-binding PadR family transcriptional regulator